MTLRRLADGGNADHGTRYRADPRQAEDEADTDQQREQNLGPNLERGEVGNCAWKAFDRGRAGRPRQIQRRPLEAGSRVSP